MRRNKARMANLGSVSSGTMRPEDLIPAFLDVADGLRLSKADRAKVRALRARVNEGTAADEEDGTEGDYFASDGAQEDLSDLFDLLNNYAPPFAYFGANEGDWSDYGFWPSMEALEDAVREGEVFKTDGSCRCAERGRSRDFAFSDHAPVCPDLRMPATARYRMVVSDHGNVSLYYRNGREVWGIV